MPRFVVAVLAAFVFVGTALAAAQPDPKQMTLRLSDLPVGFAIAPKETGRYDVARTAKENNWSVASLRQHGYVAGYALDATHNGSLKDLVSEAFEITSATSLYRAASGAKWSLAKSVTSARQHGFQVLSSGGRIGTEAHLYSYTTRKNGYAVRVYALLWRDGRVRATLLVGGLKNAVSPQQAVRLGRKQEHRITTAMHP